MAGNIQFKLLDDRIEVKNFRRSSKLLKFITRYADEPSNGVAVFDLPTAKRIVSKLVEVKSGYAKPLAAVIAEVKAKEWEMEREVELAPEHPFDKRGNYLIGGCVVRYSYPKIRCLENDVYFSRFVEMSERGYGIIRPLWFLTFTGDGDGYWYTPYISTELTSVPLNILSLVEGTVEEVRAHITGGKHRNKTAKDHEAVIRSKLTRPQRKKKKPEVISLGLTSAGEND